MGIKIQKKFQHLKIEIIQVLQKPQEFQENTILLKFSKSPRPFLKNVCYFDCNLILNGIKFYFFSKRTSH